MNIPPEILNRKGARKTSEVPKKVQELINQGLIEAKNLMELLTVNHKTLTQTVFSVSLRLKPMLPNLHKTLDKHQDKSSWNHIQLIARFLASQPSLQNSSTQKLSAQQKEVLEFLTQHPSDVVREYGCFLLGCFENIPFKQKLALMHDLADDHNPGARETAWLALRDEFIEHLDVGLTLMLDWAKSDKPNIRRFASEISRPRGVWCKHIEVLKEHPQKGEKLLNLLKEDAHKYVQDSVGNWINDAAKTNPEWAKKLTQDWLKSSDSKHTQRIVKRGLRSLK